MEQISNDVAVMDAQIKLRREECAKSMGQRSNYAAMKGAQIKLSKKECALGMVQHGQRNYAVVTDAQIKPKGEGYAKDMEHTANPNDESTAFASCFVDQNLRRLPRHFPVGIIQSFQ